MTGAECQHLYTLFYEVTGKFRDPGPVHFQQEPACLPVLQVCLPFRTGEDGCGEDRVGGIEFDMCPGGIE